MCVIIAQTHERLNLPTCPAVWAEGGQHVHATDNAEGVDKQYKCKCVWRRKERERGNSVANCDRAAEGSVKKTAEIETGDMRPETRDRRDLVLISSVQTAIM